MFFGRFAHRSLFHITLTMWKLFLHQQLPCGWDSSKGTVQRCVHGNFCPVRVKFYASSSRATHSVLPKISQNYLHKSLACNAYIPNPLRNATCLIHIHLASLEQPQMFHLGTNPEIYFELHFELHFA